ncbi:MAG: redoxin domain-containing protein [Deltaproteobacteria bacterium]|nr:redoxin domain-containing protein [Deltaproteobacteria bacterium]
MALIQSNGMPLGTPAPAFSLPGVDGVVRDLDSFEAEVLVVIFTCNHCPYAIACEDRLVAFARDYAGRAQLVLINSNDGTRYPADSFEAMQDRAKSKHSSTAP